MFLLVNSSPLTTITTSITQSADPPISDVHDKYVELNVGSLIIINNVKVI